MSRVVVGISGWSYKGWRGTFYPSKLPQRKELEFASRKLPSIEINGTFYYLQKPQSYRSWYAQTPENFIFSVKANRYISHVKRLKDVRIQMANFFASGLLCLKEKLGPLLWQFPPSMRFNPDRFESFLDLLPKNFKEALKLGNRNELEKSRVYLEIDENFPLHHAVEIRHDSFLNPWFVEMMRKHNVAIVFADTAGRWPYLEDITSDFVYIRLHGDEELYVSGYDKKTLRFWADRIDLWSKGKEPEDKISLTEKPISHIPRDIYVYFDNDAKVRAPTDAESLIRLLNKT